MNKINCKDQITNKVVKDSKLPISDGISPDNSLKSNPLVFVGKIE